MADNKDEFNKNERRKAYIDDDYFELFEDNKDDYEDVYSNSSDMEDIYSFSDSSDDIYIGKSRRREPDDSDIYIGRSHSEPNRSASVPPVRRNMAPSAPPMKVSADQNTAEFKRIEAEPMPENKNTEDISDFEARHGKKKKKPNVGKRVALIVVAVILVLIIGTGASLTTMVSGVVSKFAKAEEIQHIENVDSLRSEPHVKNILLVGADKEKGGSSRSDSMMIASVNKKTGRITVISILRDTHLDIPGKRESKVNAAYAWGGPNLLIQTIEQNFGIKIDDYATVNFEMFVSLIDGLGGIEVDVSEDEADYINNRHRYGKEEKPEKVESGENVHLSGYQALWYSRIRKLDSDFNRTERQRKVISAIMKDVKTKLNPIGIFSLSSTAKEIAPFIETTFSAGELISLGTSLVSCVTKAGGNSGKMVVTDKLPFDDTWWYSSEWDGSSISIDLEKNRTMLQHLLYDDYEIEETTTEED